MAAAFGRTVAYLREKADAAEHVAAGDLTGEDEPRSERELLGTAFRKLVLDRWEPSASLRTSSAEATRASFLRRELARSAERLVSQFSLAV
jgi:hypothetical protein